MAGSIHRIAGIILGAGTGSRMAGPTKQLLSFRGRPLLAHAVENGLAAGLSPLILVLGHQAEQIKTQLAAYPVETVVNPDYAKGITTSLAAGLKRIESLGPVAGALFLLGDQPRINASTLTTLQDTALRTPGRILIPTHKGRRGNPVYFDHRFFPELKQLTGDRGGRSVVRRHPQTVMEIPVDDPGVCSDIDTPQDYQSLCRGKDKDH